MPPKPKFTKDEILNSALEIAEKDGIDCVVARAVAKKLGTTTSPIFTFYKSMDELKSEVYDCARKKYIAYLMNTGNGLHTFKEFGFRFIEFAIDNPKIYQMLFSTENSFDNKPIVMIDSFNEVAETITNEISGEFDISKESAMDLLNQMLIYGNGIASLIISGHGSFNREQISHKLSEACFGFVTIMKIKGNSFDNSTFDNISRMLNSI